MRKAKSKDVICPTCGLGSMKTVHRSVTTRVGDVSVVVPQVRLEECVECGERMYDMNALRQIRTARESYKHHHAA